MDKVLGQDYDGLRRDQFLRDNCDSVEKLGYMKRFTPDEITERKNILAERSIEINDISIEAKEKAKEFKELLKPILEEKKQLLKDIKEKAEWTQEDCFKFIDHADGMVGYYNGEGVLVESRLMRPDESQLTITKMLKTGTEY